MRLSPARGPFDPDRERVEQLLVGEVDDEVGGNCGGGAEGPVTELVGTHQEEVAPGCVLGAVGELLQGTRLQLRRLGVVRAREDEVIDDLRNPAVVAAVERLPRVREECFGAARQRDVTLAGHLWRVRPEVGGVAVEPPQVALVDGLEVVLERPVVAPAGWLLSAVLVPTRSSRARVSARSAFV
jgi:hypothetical protein